MKNIRNGLNRGSTKDEIRQPICFGVQFKISLELRPPRGASSLLLRCGLGV